MYSSKVQTPLLLKIALIIIVLIVAFLIYKKVSEKITIDTPVNTTQELTRMLENCASQYKTKITFYTSMEPRSIDYDQVFHDIMAKNTYIGCELFAFSYYYTQEGNGLYKVELELRNPAAHRVFLTKIRVRQIADKLRGMTPYDQVKAVHDYLVLSNEYHDTISSAFNALYVGKSACNGYAFSFYAIMEELGVPVTCEYGGNHAWNKVCLDGEWYNIDVTWDDLGGKNVSYTYFLKSDEDFTGHEHGGATATKSMEVTGRSAYENYKLIPNYKLILIVSAITLLVVYLVVLRIVMNKKRKNDGGGMR